MQGFSERLTKSVGRTFKDTFKYEPVSIQFGFDTANTKENVSNFVIERRVETPFFENKYFTSAPLPTKEHIELVKDFEAMLKG